MTSTRPIFALAPLALCALAASAGAQTSITLFGQSYRVDRFNYSDQIQMPSILTPGMGTVPLFEAEGLTYVGNDRLIISADDIADIAIGEPDNWFVEFRLIGAPGPVTGLEYTRTIATVDAGAQGYDPNPGGVTINTSATGLGAGGNLVVSGNDGFLFAYANGGALAGQLLQVGQNAACAQPAGGCNLDISAQNFNAEDVTFVPGAGVRQPSFFVINQDLGGLDIAGVERWSVTGQLLGTFPVGGAVQANLAGAVAKGITYVADSPRLPAAIRRPEGVVLVSFDRDFPALQAFTVDGALLGTEILTTTGTPAAPFRLDMSGCSLRMHIESLAADGATGRLFLCNQGSFLSCNYLWVLTPSCSPDVAGAGQTIGADGQLTADDIIVFIGWFFAADARADFAGSGQVPTPDGQFTADDIIVFINRFFAGC